VSLWVVTFEYDVANCKTNIVSVESYEDFIVSNGPFRRSTRTSNTDMIEAIDALDAWKKAREMHREYYRERLHGVGTAQHLT
jgi:hypothetical protein